MCYSATYGVGVRQSPVTSRQFGPTDLQNTWPTTSLRSPHCIIVLCYASLSVVDFWFCWALFWFVIVSKWQRQYEIEWQEVFASLGIDFSS